MPIKDAGVGMRVAKECGMAPMQTTDVIVVRVYLSENSQSRDSLLKRLRDWGGIRGATIFEARRGFGENESKGIPMVLEFYERPDKAQEMIEYLDRIVAPGHVVFWRAQTRVATDDT